MAGLLISSFTFGVLSDKFGRRHTLLAGQSPILVWRCMVHALRRSVTYPCLALDGTRSSQVSHLSLSGAAWYTLHAGQSPILVWRCAVHPPRRSVTYPCLALRGISSAKVVTYPCVALLGTLLADHSPIIEWCCAAQAPRSQPALRVWCN